MNLSIADLGFFSELLKRDVMRGSIKRLSGSLSESKQNFDKTEMKNSQQLL